MLETPAIVTGTRAETALVEAHYGGGCGSGMCAKGGCGAAILGQLFTSTPRGPMQALNPIQAHAGDRVMIGVEEGMLLRTTGVAYLMPLLMLLGGAVLGQGWSVGDAGAAIGALSGLLLGWAAARVVARRITRRTLPVILRRI
jgi:sigma-E factor negative regulatory protein RseC